MNARFFEGLEGRQLFAGTPVGPGPIGDGAGTQDRIQQKLRDSSCQTTATVAVSADAVKDQIRQRLKDGSCKD